jgi:hypothetical protein
MPSDKKVADNVVESWHCVDCGVNTAPGIPDGPTLRAYLALTGKCETRLTRDSEVYTVRDGVWAKAGMTPWGGCLCVGCLEKRLGRRLKSEDFQRRHEFNRQGVPRSARLADRLKV